MGPRVGLDSSGKSRPAGIRSSDRPAHSDCAIPARECQAIINHVVNECPDATKSRRMAECRLRGISNLRHVHVPINSETREKF